MHVLNFYLYPIILMFYHYYMIIYISHQVKKHNSSHLNCEFLYFIWLFGSKETIISFFYPYLQIKYILHLVKRLQNLLHLLVLLLIYKGTFALQYPILSKSYHLNKIRSFFHLVNMKEHLLCHCAFQAKICIYMSPYPKM